MSLNNEALQCKETEGKGCRSIHKRLKQVSEENESRMRVETGQAAKEILKCNSLIFFRRIVLSPRKRSIRYDNPYLSQPHGPFRQIPERDIFQILQQLLENAYY